MWGRWLFWPTLYICCQHWLVSCSQSRQTPSVLLCTGQSHNTLPLNTLQVFVPRFTFWVEGKGISCPLQAKLYHPTLPIFPLLQLGTKMKRDVSCKFPSRYLLPFPQNENWYEILFPLKMYYVCFYSKDSLYLNSVVKRLLREHPLQWPKCLLRELSQRGMIAPAQSWQRQSSQPDIWRKTAEHRHVGWAVEHTRLPSVPKTNTVLVLLHITVPLGRSCSALHSAKGPSCSHARN